MKPEPPFGWSRSRTNVVGAGACVGSGALDLQSRSRPNMWRFRNTGINNGTALTTGYPVSHMTYIPTSRVLLLSFHIAADRTVLIGL